MSTEIEMANTLLIVLLFFLVWNQNRRINEVEHLARVAVLANVKVEKK